MERLRRAVYAGHPLPDANPAVLSIKPSPPSDRLALRDAALQTITAPRTWTPSLHGGAGRAPRVAGTKARRPNPGREAQAMSTARTRHGGAAKTYRLQEVDETGQPTDEPLRVVTTVLGIEDLVCPICEDPVSGDPPVGDGGEWSHTDGTPLCGDSDPIEAR